MSTEYRAFSNGGIKTFQWPNHCAACNRPAAGVLQATSSSTSNAKFFVAYASWTSTPVTIEYPACWRHKVLHYFPMKLTGHSMWHAVLVTIAVLAAIGGVLGFGRILIGAESATLSAMNTYLICFAPTVILGMAARFSPVRVTGFQPPVVWFKIRNRAVCAEFEKLNEGAIQLPR